MSLYVRAWGDATLYFVWFRDKYILGNDAAYAVAAGDVVMCDIFRSCYIWYFVTVCLFFFLSLMEF
jgi:hypothetical protein